MIRVNNEFIVSSRSPNLNLENRIRRSSNRFKLNGHWEKNEKGNQRELSTFLNDLCKLTVSKLLLCDPKHGRRSRGRPATTFIDQLESDTGLSRQDLAPVMANRREWDRLIKLVRVRPKYIDRFNSNVTNTSPFQILYKNKIFSLIPFCFHSSVAKWNPCSRGIVWSMKFSIPYNSAHSNDVKYPKLNLNHSPQQLVSTKATYGETFSREAHFPTASTSASVYLRKLCPSQEILSRMLWLSGLGQVYPAGRAKSVYK